MRLRGGRPPLLVRGTHLKPRVAASPRRKMIAEVSMVLKRKEEEGLVRVRGQIDGEEKKFVSRFPSFLLLDFTDLRFKNFLYF